MKMPTVFALAVSTLIFAGPTLAGDDKDAKDYAPGQTKPEGSSAKRYAPGQMKSDDGSAKEYAPGQRANEGAGEGSSGMDKSTGSSDPAGKVK